MRRVNDEGQFEDTCVADGSCDSCTSGAIEEEILRDVEIPEVGGNPFADSSPPIPPQDPLGVEYIGNIKLSPVQTLKQIGGTHYKGFEIQPATFVTRNKFGYLQGSIIYRLCRYNKKGTPLEDLQKAKHEIDLLIEIENLQDRRI